GEMIGFRLPGQLTARRQQCQAQGDDTPPPLRCQSQNHGCSPGSPSDPPVPQPACPLSGRPPGTPVPAGGTSICSLRMTTTAATTPNTNCARMNDGQSTRFCKTGLRTPIRL